MVLYPVFLKIKNRKCLVIGGGVVAERKTMTLLEAGARVSLISPDLTAYLEKLVALEKIKYQRRSYRRGDLKGYFLAIAATSVPEINKRIFDDSEAFGVLINSVDDPENSNFFVPSTLRRGSLQIAISTSGKVPYFAKKVRQFLEWKFYKEIARDIEILNRLRAKIIKETRNDPELKKKKFEEVLKPKIEDILQKVEKR